MESARADATDGTFESSDIVILESNQKALALAICVPFFLSIGVSSVLYSFFGMDGDAFLVPFSPAIIILVLGTSLVHFNVRRRRRGLVRASSEGLFVDGALWIPRQEIKSARAALWKYQVPVLRLRLRDRFFPIDLQVKDEQEARAIERALHFDASSSVADFVLGWATLYRGDGARIVFAGLGAAMVLVVLCIALLAVVTAVRGVHINDVGGEWGLALIVLYAPLLLFLKRRSNVKLSVGPDGLVVRQWGRSRFIKHDEIKRLEPWSQERVKGYRMPSQGVDVVLASGENIALYTGGQRMSDGNTQRDGLAERIEQARTAAHTSSSPSDSGSDNASLLMLMNTTELEPKAWIAQMRALGTGALGGHRDAAIPTERLWSIVRDVRAAPMMRISAALAARAVGSEGDRDELSTIAQATASPQLRIALESAAEGDDATLESVLAEIKTAP